MPHVTRPSSQDARSPEPLASATRRLVVKVRELAPLAIPASSATQDGTDDLGSLLGSTVVQPEFDPGTLKRIRQNSSCLNQNIQAYATNIDGQGHRIKSAVDFDSDEAWWVVKESLWRSAMRTEERRGGAVHDPEACEPSDLEVDAAVKRLTKQARMERVRLEAFLRSANPDGTFVALRVKTRRDLEESGNAYWEVLRTKRGELARLVHVPHEDVRCTKLDEEPVLVDERMPFDLLEWSPVKQHRFFRRYVQVVGRRVTWFKQFGDPRIVSQQTGAIYTDLADFERRAQQGDRPANEVIHFKIEDSGSAYGVPRWMGVLLSVLGSRAADEVNFDYFDNKAVPPMALLVQGGELSPDAVKRIEDHFRDRARGRENFHKVLVIEAIGADNELMPGEQAVVPRLKFERLVDAQQGDALFQNYDERNIDKVGSAFRLPRLLRGDSRDFNRATSESALKFADEQVFEPERNDFDAFMNRVVLPELGISLLEFRSLGPRTRDLDSIVEAAERLTKAAVLTPNEARSIVAEVVGRELPPFDRPFARQPLPITMAGIMPEADEVVSAREDRLRDLMLEAQAAVEDAGGERWEREMERAVDAARRHARDGAANEEGAGL
jgi:PBSX family phage portal protein